MKRNYLIIFLVIASLLLGACSGAADNGYMESSAEADGAAQEYAETADEAAPEAAQEDWDYETEDGEYDEGALFDSLEEPSEGGESYLVIDENTEVDVSSESVITFSLKVDTAAYTNVVRFLENGDLPPRDAVRIEELINYFNYDGDMAFGDDPFALYAEVGPSPFDSGKHMAFVRVKTPDVPKEELPSLNLTFLVDTSGSMSSHDKLPLLKKSLAELVEVLDEDDIVSIVTYAGSSEILLDSVSGADKELILDALSVLDAGGSTAGADGIVTAYALAEKNFMPAGNNRIILASDGDFNVGISNLDDLSALISEKRDSGVYLSVLGFGTGNVRDDIMETLAADGNGNYSYINNLATGRKVLVEEMGSNLFTVADDVKAQVEFNPLNVKNYRLIGYENRTMDNRDFNDDTKDAGEIGVGTDVVMMFELELQDEVTSSSEPYGYELFEVRINYKNPGESKSNPMVLPVTFDSIPDQNTPDFQFACAVAAFGHLLRDSDYTGDADVQSVYALAEGSLGRDEGGYRAAFLELVERYQSISRW